MKDCPCCSGELFENCCQAIIAGTTLAATPLELMRSRYTAHVCKNMAHIIRTMRDKALKLFDEEKTKDEWFEQCEWTKLEIVNAPEITKKDLQGIVEFKAHYIFNGEQHCLHERSKFSKAGNKWYYVGVGRVVDPDGVGGGLRAAPVIGRNDACGCGSGKKYKKCCA